MELFLPFKYHITFDAKCYIIFVLTAESCKTLINLFILLHLFTFKYTAALEAISFCIKGIVTRKEQYEFKHVRNLLHSINGRAKEFRRTAMHIK